jgi:hypothetical protein
VGSSPINHQWGHKAIEKSLGATFRNSPKGISYGLVTRFSRIFLVGSIPANHQSGHKAIETSLGATS